MIPADKAQSLNKSNYRHCLMVKLSYESHCNYLTGLDKCRKNQNQCSTNNQPIDGIFSTRNVETCLVCNTKPIKKEQD